MNKVLREPLRMLLPRTVKTHRILRGPLRGTRIVTSWHDYPSAILGRTETALLAWFEANIRHGETWIDVGAHYGYTALALCRLVGPQGRVYAFEPVLNTAGHLGTTRTINELAQLFVLPFALSDSPRMTMVQMPTVRGMAYQGAVESGVGENMLTVSFDTIWGQICCGDPRMDGIKIDVQGMEIEVLRGMHESIRKFRPKLVVEIHHGVDRSELLDLIESLGYSGRGLPVEPCAGEVDPRYFDDRSYVFVISERSAPTTEKKDDQKEGAVASEGLWRKQG